MTQVEIEQMRAGAAEAADWHCNDPQCSSPGVGNACHRGRFFFTRRSCNCPCHSVDVRSLAFYVRCLADEVERRGAEIRRLRAASAE